MKCCIISWYIKQTYLIQHVDHGTTCAHYPNCKGYKPSTCLTHTQYNLNTCGVCTYNTTSLSSLSSHAPIFLACDITCLNVWKAMHLPFWSNLWWRSEYDSDEQHTNSIVSWTPVHCDCKWSIQSYYDTPWIYGCLITISMLISIRLTCYFSSMKHDLCAYMVCNAPTI